MADRYWVGGTETWDATSGTKWSDTSGGGGGSSVPGASDNVFFDANSGAGTVTIGSGRSCINLVCTGFTGTIAGTSAPKISGNLTLASGMGFSNTGTWDFNGVGAGTQTINTAGKTLSGIIVQEVAVDTTLSLGADCTCSGAFSTSGSATLIIDLNGHTLSVSTMDLSALGTTTLKFSAGTLDLTTTSTVSVLTVSLGSLVVNRTGGGTVKISGSTTNVRTFVARGTSWPTLEFSNATARGELNITGGGTFSSITNTSTTPQAIKVVAGTTITVEDANGLPSGVSGNLLTWTSTTAAAHTVAKTGAGNVACSYLNLSYSATSSAGVFSADHSTDGGLASTNSNWAMTAPMLYPYSGSPPSFAVEYKTNSATWVDVASSTLRFNLEQAVFDPLHPVHGLEALVEIANDQGTFNPVALAPLNIGREMRISITETNSRLFSGRIKNINLNPGVGQKVTLLNLESFLSFYDRTSLTTSMQVGANPASLFAHVMSQINSTTGLYSAEAINPNDNISFAWYTDRQVSGALQQIVEYGFYPMREHGDGVLQLYNRATGLVGGGGAVDTITDCFGMAVTWDSGDIFNDIKISGNPRHVDTNPATVAWLQEMVSVPASSSVGFWLTYVDPTEISLATPAVSLTTPVTSSDWVLNTQSDNGGSYLMATASLSTTFFGQTSVVSLFNGSGSTGYLTKFQVRGLSVRQSPTISGRTQNNSSQLAYGVHQRAFSNDFIDKQDFVQQYATYLVGERGEPQPRLSFSLKNDWPTMDKVVPGANLGVVNSNAGVNSTWVIRRVTHDVTLASGFEHVLSVEAEYFNDVPWLVLDHATRGQLSNGNKLAW